MSSLQVKGEKVSRTGKLRTKTQLTYGVGQEVAY